MKVWRSKLLKSAISYGLLALCAGTAGNWLSAPGSLWAQGSAPGGKPAPVSTSASPAPAVSAPAVSAPAETAPGAATGAPTESTTSAPAKPATPGVATEPESPLNAGEAPTKELTQAEWREEFKLLNELIQRYDEGVKYFKSDVDEIIARKKRDEQERIQQTYDTRYQKLAEEVRVRREQAIAAFERFIQKYPDSEHTPLAMFRLADLYFDEAAYAYQDASNRYTELLSKLGQDQEPPPEPRQDFGKSLALYERIVREFPNFKHIDGVYYMRGYLLSTETAIQYDILAAKLAWEELIRKRPDSQYSSQAYLRIGEYFFEMEGNDQSVIDENVNRAIEYYDKVISYHDKWEDRALYKKAWALYRLAKVPKQYERAIEYFVALLDLSLRQFEETGRESDLRAEATEYLAISLSDYGTVNDAVAYFEKIGDRSYKKDVLKRLAEIYRDAARYEEAIQAFTRMQELFPFHEDNPFFQYEIVKLYNTQQNSAAAIEENEKLIRMYHPAGKWAEALNQQKSVLNKAQELVQERLKNLAYYYHDQANNAARAEDRQKYFNLAADKYREYLKTFPYAREAYEMQYYFGDCLFFSGQFEDAAIEYDKAMTYTEAKFHAEAARGMVESYENIIRIKEGAEGVEKPFVVAAEAPKEASALTPEQEEMLKTCPEVAKNPNCMADKLDLVPLSALKKKYIDAIDILAKVAPGLDLTPTYKFKAAMIYFYHGQFDLAEKRYREIIDSESYGKADVAVKYGKADVAVKSAQFVVDGLVMQKKWARVLEAVDGFKGTVLGPEPRAWNQALSKLLEIQERSRPLEAACLCNIEEQITRWKGLGTDVGWINAARLEEKLGRVDDALGSYQSLISKYPRTEFLEEALYRMAFNYEKFLDLQRAIESYERLVQSFPRSDKAPTCTYNMAFLYQGMKEFRKSARAYENYALVYPNQDDAELAYFTAITVITRTEDWNEVIRLSREYIRRYQGPRMNADRYVTAHVNIVQAYDKLNRPKDALEWEKKVLQLAPSLQSAITPYGNNLHAKIMFREMPRMVEAMNAIKFSSNVKQLQAQLERKMQLITQIEARKDEIVKLTDPEFASAAFMMTGKAFQDFAESLRGAAPEGLDEESQEIFDSMIEEYVGPIEEKAKAYYLANLDLEAKGLFNEWIEKTYTQLNIMLPSDYPARKKERSRYSLSEQTFIEGPMPMTSGTSGS
ncbi:MAG: tetratricopeptide repeat protein [Myxococcota bacterium]